MNFALKKKYMYLFLWKYTDFKNIVQGPQFMCIIGIDIFKKKVTIYILKA